MQNSPENTPSAPDVQPPTSSRLAKTSLRLGILSASSFLSIPCLILMEVLWGPRYPDLLPGLIMFLGFGFGLLAGLPAIIIGHVAYRRARRAPDQYGGAGFARSGISLGYLGLFVALLFLAAVLPNLPRPHTYAYQKACVLNLKKIDTAKAQWALENHKQPGEPVVEDQVNAYLPQSARPICPAGGVYTYNAVGVPPACSLGAVQGHTL